MNKIIKKLLHNIHVHKDGHSEEEEYCLDVPMTK